MTGAGILLLIIFIVFIQRTNLSWVRNWWAFLFLIPAIGSINNVLSELQKKKGFSFSLASNLMGIIFPLALCLIFLFGLSWEINLPIIIILSGITLFVMGFINDEGGAGKLIRHLRYWFISWGTAVILVGVITLISTQNPIDQQSIDLWYSGALLLSSLGGFITGVVESIRKRKISALIFTHLFVAIILTIPAIYIILS